jgi:hypothetical protein
MALQPDCSQGDENIPIAMLIGVDPAAARVSPFRCQTGRQCDGRQQPLRKA